MMAKIDLTVLGLDQVREFILNARNVIVVDGVARYIDSHDIFSTATTAACSQGYNYEREEQEQEDDPHIIDCVAYDVEEPRQLKDTND